MKGITFSRLGAATSDDLHSASALLPNGNLLTVCTATTGDRVSVGLAGNMVQSWMVFTTEQARSLAAELVQCCNAYDNAQRQQSAAGAGCGGVKK